MSQLKVFVDAYQPTKSIYVKFIVDDDQLSKRLMMIDKKLKPLMSKDGKGVQLIVPEKAVSNFVDGQILPKIYSMCESNGFSVPNIQSVKDDITVSVKSIVTAEMKGAATKRTNDLIEEFFDKYSDPEVMNVINQLVHDIKINVGDDNALSHALLSKKNRIMAYAQKPDAKYIASPKTWRTVFNRRVLPHAQVIIINAGNNGNQYDTSYADSTMGMDKSTAYNNSHLRVSYDKLAKYGQTDPTEFYGVAYYDISDTVSYDETDRYNDDAGLESNLTGSLNQKALEQVPNVEVDSDLIKNNKTNESRIFSNIVEFSKNKPEYKAVMIAAHGKDPNDSNSSADVIEALFRVKFEREHNSELLNQKVKKCTAFVLSIYDAATNRMIGYMAQNNDMFNRKALTEMYSQILDVVDIIDNTVKESIGGNPPTFKEFLDALHIDISKLNNQPNTEMNNQPSDISQEKEKLGESFRRLWNKII